MQRTVEDFMRVVRHTMKVNRTFGLSDFIFTLSSDSWVAVQSDYTPFFPPGFGTGQLRRSINAYRMPSLSDQLLSPRYCALPDILRSCLTVDVYKTAC